MLAIYSVVIEVVGGVRPLVERIEKCDRDLGCQLRRAISSVALNLAEGMGVGGRSRRVRYATALGSMRESAACLDVARAFGYVGEIDPVLLDKMDRVMRTLHRLQ